MLTILGLLIMVVGLLLMVSTVSGEIILLGMAVMFIGFLITGKSRQ